MHPTDATSLGVLDGAIIKITSNKGEAEAPVEITDAIMTGHVSLPHGFGIEYPDEAGEHKIHGVSLNELTEIKDRDWLALTPFHKHVRVALEAVYKDMSALASSATRFLVFSYLRRHMTSRIFDVLFEHQIQ
jgi:anaerobic selenocysteine-containing dehydrogenase